MVTKAKGTECGNVCKRKYNNLIFICLLLTGLNCVDMEVE